jgi:hypothetical protein
LASEGRYAPPRKKKGVQDKGERVNNRQCGLVAPNFFIPTPTMRKFREQAKKEATKQNIWSLVNLPGFDDWFLDWTRGKAHQGKSYQVALSSTPTHPRNAENGSPEAANADGHSQMGGKQHPGRPKGSKGKKAERRRAKVIRDWKSGEYHTIAAVARANHIDRTTAS